MKWIEEWLRGRYQWVLSGICSSWGRVTGRVPQESVLGPVLFLTYVNDLECFVSNWILKFADDSKLFGKTQDPIDNQQTQQDLSRLIQW